MIKAIDTRYGGYLFRSRLEARWAVFFDKLGLSWTYEVEGFDIDGLRYLPDFRVLTPQGEPIWYEVKPAGTASDPKFHAFKEALSRENPDGLVRAELLCGDPLDVIIRSDICPRCGAIHKDMSDLHWHRYPFDASDPYVSTWGQDQQTVYCYPCDAETPYGGGHDPEPGFQGVSVEQSKGTLHISLREWIRVESNVLMPAARAARAARFEFGGKQ